MGLVPKTDVFHVKLTYLRQEQQSLTAKEQLSANYKKLNTYINLSQDEPIIIDKDIAILNWKPQNINLKKILEKNYL